MAVPMGTHGGHRGGGSGNAFLGTLIQDGAQKDMRMDAVCQFTVSCTVHPLATQDPYLKKKKSNFNMHLPKI